MWVQWFPFVNFQHSLIHEYTFESQFIIHLFIILIIWIYYFELHVEYNIYPYWVVTNMMSVTFKIKPKKWYPTKGSQSIFLTKLTPHSSYVYTQLLLIMGGLIYKYTYICIYIHYNIPFLGQKKLATGIAI